MVVFFLYSPIAIPLVQLQNLNDQMVFGSNVTLPPYAFAELVNAQQDPTVFRHSPSLIVP